MPNTSFECVECNAAISPTKVLAAIAEQGVAHEIVEEGRDLTMTCPHCESSFTFRTADIIVKLSADEGTLALLRTLQKTAEATTTDWEPNFEEVIEREKESQRRRERIEEKLQEIKDSL
jgi:predicted secreted protein